MKNVVEKVPKSLNGLVLEVILISLLHSVPVYGLFEHFWSRFQAMYRKPNDQILVAIQKAGLEFKWSAKLHSM